MEQGYYPDNVFQWLRYTLFHVPALVKTRFVEPECYQWQRRTMTLFWLCLYFCLTPDKFLRSVDSRNHIFVWC